MDTILEEESSFYRPSGSTYIKINPTFMKYLEIQVNANNEIISDAKTCMGMGKHGAFIYIYSPKQQQKWKKEKLAEQKEQLKINGGEKQ